MSTREPLPGFDDRAPSDRYCDLILTGGVTSSIAYPAAIFALGMVYRFNSIGGASSGAGAAALAAAAEYRRRHGSSDGFRIMLERAASVADEVDSGKTRLEWLFQPEKENKRLFDALLPGFAKPTGKLMALAGGLLRAYAKILLAIAVVFLIAGLGALVGAALGYIGGWWGLLIGIGGTALFFIAIVVALVVLFARDVGRIVRYDYGLCRGSGSRDAPVLPFTDWLHSLIQEIAGRRAGERPLTFADLAAAPGSPRETLNDPSPTGAASISLQMFTANVTHGRPYVFPQNEGGEDDLPLFFRSSEMNRLFPPDVVKDMEVDPVTGQSNEYQEDAKPARERARVVRERGLRSRAMGLVGSLAMGKSPVVGSKEEPMYRLPTKHLPILVAARMSVSFPILFSAVPLWILDKRDEKKHVFRRCLFCDGGICSNFPIHLFDSPIPSWPTFGISLHELPTSKTDPAKASSPLSDQALVRLPKSHLDQGEDQWNEFETEPEPLERLSGFFSALASTTINWSDATLARLPGVRERVVRIGLPSEVGGLNIQMKEKKIRELADLGREAAVELLKRYALPAPRPSGVLADGWNEHRWVRLNVLRDSLSRSLAGLTWAALQAQHGKPLRDLIRQATDEPMLKKDDDESVLKNDESVPKKEDDEPVQKDNDSQLLAAQAAALEGALDALMQAERALNMPTVGQPYRPSPRPVMRVRPPL